MKNLSEFQSRMPPRHCDPRTRSLGRASVSDLFQGGANEKFKYFKSAGKLEISKHNHPLQCFQLGEEYKSYCRGIPTRHLAFTKAFS